MPTTFRDATLSWRPKTGIPPETCRNFGHPHHRLPLTVQVRFAWGWRKSGFPVINSHADSLPRSRHAAAVWPFYFLACNSHADPGPRSRHAAAVWPFYFLACNSHADLGPPDCAVHAVKHGMNATIRSPWVGSKGPFGPPDCAVHAVKHGMNATIRSPWEAPPGGSPTHGRLLQDSQPPLEEPPPPCAKWPRWPSRSREAHGGHASKA